MELKQKLESDLHSAMRNRDNVRKQTIRMILTNIKLTEVEKNKTLDDVEIINLLYKEAKTRQEAIEDAKKANRPDLIQANQDEIAVVEGYLPKSLSDDEIRDIAQAVIEELKSSNPTVSSADMGKVMKSTLLQTAGRAPNDKISRVVRSLLQK
jgi:uncharacterized protein